MTSSPDFEKANEVIKHYCKDDIAIRNPTGKCDHLEYPSYCETCKELSDPMSLLEKIRALESQNQALREALERIFKVTQFDHPASQIIGSEEYEGAWLDCVEIAQKALSICPSVPDSKMKINK